MSKKPVLSDGTVLNVKWPTKEVENLGEHIDLARVCEHLSGAIQIQTISHVDENDTDWSKFEEFHAYLRESYPLVHEKLELTEIGKAGLLYYWKGTDESLDPIGFLSHQDVVPIEEGTEGDWTHPPFSGYNDGKIIWGRGALDMKDHLISVIEAVECLLEDGYQPKRGIYLMFGYNEEIVAGDSNAAEKIAKYLEEKGVHLDSTVDEGGAMIPLNYKPVLNTALAGIGIAEKGYADYKVTVHAKGGHTSAPPDHTALGKLAKKVVNLEKHQFPAEMPEYFKDLIKAVAVKCPQPVRFILANIDAIEEPVTWILCKIPAAASFIRSCMAVTMAEASPAANVQPQQASVVINFRMLPGLTMEGVKKYIHKYMGKDVTVELLKGKEASAISPKDSRAFKTLGDVTLKMHPEAVVTPYMVMGGTDSYHYENVCENIYRFAPFAVSAGLLLTTHSTNERIPVEQLGNGVAFFKQYMKEMTKE